MKFTATREELLTPLQQVVSVIEKRQTMPILSNVLIQLDYESLTLTGTDLEIQLIIKLHLPQTNVGSITVPARKLLDICRLLPQGSQIDFEWTGEKMKVVSGRSRFSLSTLPSENYPEFSESAFEHQFFINAGKFKKALEKTTFCMANQDVRYYLNGLLMHVSNKIIKLVASDGHRLSIHEDQLQEGTNAETRIILPRKGVLEFMRLLDDLETDVKVEYSANNIRFFYKHLIFSAKLVDSKYPDFNKVFQQQASGILSIPKIPLKESLTRVAILSNEKFKGVTLDISSDILKLSAHNPEHEEAEEEILIDYPGEPLSISFNVQYLLDALANLDSDTAVFTISNNTSTCFIEEVDEKNYKFIVMPMKL